MNNNKPTLIYMFDALCGWCYGYSQQIVDFYNEHHSELNIKVLSGGMVLGEREGPIGKASDFIKGALTQVEQLSGAKFGQRFKDNLEIGTMYHSSLPPARALATYKALKGTKPLHFATELQKAIYFKGMASTELETFLYVLSQMPDQEISNEDFTAYYIDKKSLQDAQNEFDEVSKFGVNGFPTTVLFYKEQYFLMARGFTQKSNLNKVYNSILTKE